MFNQIFNLMVNSYNKKADSRKTKTPNNSKTSNQRGDKVASGIINKILFTKIRRICPQLINMIKNRFYRQLDNNQIKYKSTYDLCVWCLYYLNVMENPQIDNILDHIINCVKQRLQQGQTHPNQKFRRSKISQFKRYLSSLVILKKGFDMQNVKNAISSIYGTKERLAIVRIKLIENFDWSIYSRTNIDINYVKVYQDHHNVSNKNENQFQNKSTPQQIVIFQTQNCSIPQLQIEKSQKEALKEFQNEKFDENSIVEKKVEHNQNEYFGSQWLYLGSQERQQREDIMFWHQSELTFEISKYFDLKSE